MGLEVDSSQLGCWFGFTAVHHVTLFSVSEKYLRLTLIPPYHLKFLHRCHCAATFCGLGHLRDVSVLSATVSYSHVAGAALQVHSLDLSSERGPLFFSWPCWSPHVKRIDLTLVKFLSLGLIGRHCSILLILELLESHLWHKGRTRVWATVSWHDIGLIDGCNFLHIVCQILLATRLRLRSSILAVLLKLFPWPRLLFAVSSYACDFQHAIWGTMWGQRTAIIRRHLCLIYLTWGSIEGCRSICDRASIRATSNRACGLASYA